MMFFRSNQCQKKTPKTSVEKQSTGEPSHPADKTRNQRGGEKFFRGRSLEAATLVTIADKVFRPVEGGGVKKGGGAPDRSRPGGGGNQKGPLAVTKEYCGRKKRRGAACTLREVWCAQGPLAKKTARINSKGFARRGEP